MRMYKTSLIGLLVAILSIPTLGHSQDPAKAEIIRRQQAEIERRKRQNEMARRQREAGSNPALGGVGGSPFHLGQPQSQLAMGNVPQMGMNMGLRGGGTMRMGSTRTPKIVPAADVAHTLVDAKTKLDVAAAMTGGMPYGHHRGGYYEEEITTHCNHEEKRECQPQQIIINKGDTIFSPTTTIKHGNRTVINKHGGIRTVFSPRSHGGNFTIAPKNYNSSNVRNYTSSVVNANKRSVYSPTSTYATKITKNSNVSNKSYTEILNKQKTQVMNLWKQKNTTVVKPPAPTPKKNPVVKVPTPFKPKPPVAMPKKTPVIKVPSPFTPQPPRTTHSPPRLPTHPQPKLPKVMTVSAPSNFIPKIPKT